MYIRLVKENNNIKQKCICKYLTVQSSSDGTCDSFLRIGSFKQNV